VDLLFDIFKLEGDGSLLWLEAVGNLPAARERLVSLQATTPGEYLVYSLGTSQLVASSKTSSKSQGAAA